MGDVGAAMGRAIGRNRRGGYLILLVMVLVAATGDHVQGRTHQMCDSVAPPVAGQPRLETDILLADVILENAVCTYTGRSGSLYVGRSERQCPEACEQARQRCSGTGDAPCTYLHCDEKERPLGPRID